MLNLTSCGVAATVKTTLDPTLDLLRDQMPEIRKSIEGAMKELQKSLALGRRSNLPLIKGLCVGFIELIRGVPLISLLIMASVMLPLFLPTGVTFDKFLRAQVAVILFAGAYIAEIIRGGLQSLPKGQFEAADAMGLNYVQKTTLIILPQALRVVIPPLINTFIGFFKDTSLVLIIGIFDFLNTANQALVDPAWAGYPGEVYLFAAFVYFCFCFSMSRRNRFSATIATLMSQARFAKVLFWGGQLPRGSSAHAQGWLPGPS